MQSTFRVERFRLLGLVFAAGIGILGTPARAQIPDEFKNLKILKPDIKKGELVGMMRGFASALGVRCLHCHVGQHDDLTGADFASDEKETKRVARVMIEMTQEINTRLLPKTGRTELLTVQCSTCHRGLTRPERIDDILLKDMNKSGLDTAIQNYREQRDKHGRDGAYDFTARPLNTLGEALAAKKDFESSVAVMRLAVELNPDSSYSHFLLAKSLAGKGDHSAAVASMEKAVALEPDNSWYQEELEKLKAEGAAKP